MIVVKSIMDEFHHLIDVAFHCEERSPSILLFFFVRRCHWLWFNRHLLLIEFQREISDIYFGKRLRGWPLYMWKVMEKDSPPLQHAVYLKNAIPRRLGKSPIIKSNEIPIFRCSFGPTPVRPIRSLITIFSFIRFTL